MYASFKSWLFHTEIMSLSHPYPSPSILGRSILMRAYYEMPWARSPDYTCKEQSEAVSHCSTLHNLTSFHNGISHPRCSGEIAPAYHWSGAGLGRLLMSSIPRLSSSFSNIAGLHFFFGALLHTPTRHDPLSDLYILVASFEMNIPLHTPTRHDPLSDSIAAGVQNCSIALRNTVMAFSDVASRNSWAATMRREESSMRFRPSNRGSFMTYRSTCHRALEYFLSYRTHLRFLDFAGDAVTRLLFFMIQYMRRYWSFLWAWQLYAIHQQAPFCEYPEPVVFLEVWSPYWDGWRVREPDTCRSCGIRSECAFARHPLPGYVRGALSLTDDVSENFFISGTWPCFSLICRISVSRFWTLLNTHSLAL